MFIKKFFKSFYNNLNSIKIATAHHVTDSEPLIPSCIISKEKFEAYIKNNKFVSFFEGIKNFKTKFVKNEEGRYINQDDIIIYDQNPGTDVYEGINGYTTLVPLKVSQSDADSIEKINNLLKK